MKIAALLAGTALALVPTGVALAADGEPNVPGRGLGNCQHSSAGGNAQTALPDGGKNKGNGGLRGVECADKAPVFGPYIPPVDEHATEALDG